LGSAKSNIQNPLGPWLYQYIQFLKWANKTKDPSEVQVVTPTPQNVRISQKLKALKAASVVESKKSTTLSFKYPSCHIFQNTFLRQPTTCNHTSQPKILLGG
jgi:hypothetical protein